MTDAAELARQWFDAIHANDVDGAVARLADDVDFVAPGVSFRGSGPARSFLQGYVEAFPDATFDIRSETSVGSRAVLEGVYVGTNSGPMPTPQGEMPATGRSVSLPFVTIVESVDGERISSHRAYWDQMDFMAQLGMMGSQDQG
jgi:steroid delta-isomerase-like uncharacterized protein